MIVSHSLMRRRPDLQQSAFEEHWISPHGELAAALPGCTRYVQNHIRDVPATNALARSLRIDGIPQLWFVDASARAAAHGSPELAACDMDSRLFVGAVSRVITQASDTLEGDIGKCKCVVLFVRAKRPAGESDANAAARRQHALAGLPGVRARIDYAVIEQGGAPGSTVANLGIDVDAVVDLWFDDAAAAARAISALEAVAPDAASFAVTVREFI